MVDCTIFSEARFKCHSTYGKWGEDCLHQELSEKRCLSVRHCPIEAKQYYGNAPLTSNVIASLTNKGMCASFAESFAYADKEMEYWPEAANHHRNAREIVSKDRGLKRECRDIAFALARCLQYKY